jgi:hypothetical protein
MACSTSGDCPRQTHAKSGVSGGNRSYRQRKNLGAARIRPHAAGFRKQPTMGLFSNLFTKLPEMFNERTLPRFLGSVSSFLLLF